jgi:alpha-L-fucosidase 2
MRLFNFFFLFMMGSYTLIAQDTNKSSPASLSTTKITAKWTDRANVKDGGANPGGPYVLWYQKPAVVWEEALPLGNGQLGAMIFGGIADERIQLNESTLWDGYPLDPNDPSSLENLPEVRKLLFEGKNNEAVALAGKHMMFKQKKGRLYS